MIKKIHNDLSFEEIIALKVKRQKEKLEKLRNISDEERKELNEKNAERCLEIAAQFSKSRRYLAAVNLVELGGAAQGMPDL